MSVDILPDSASTRSQKVVCYLLGNADFLNENDPIITRDSLR
ncbi:hypothetical protein [Candidatus Regiella insecticola]|nr:hypothetical protein [Candidatus Regiella insecticola]